MLRSYTITADNCLSAVSQLRKIANSKDITAEAMVLRKTATTIERFIESPASAREIAALKSIGQKLDSKSVIVYADTIEGTVEYEYMLIAECGTHYERNELNLNNFPLLTEDQIYSNAEEVRLSRNEYSESGDYWESVEAEEDCGVW